MTHRWKFVLVAAVIAPGLMACESSTSGSPTSVSAAPVQLFDPCTGIPDDVLVASGVKPSTKETGIAGVEQSGWEICAWNGSTYSLTIYSTGRTVAEFESKGSNVDFKDVTVAGRPGRQFRVAGTSKDLGCDVVFSATQGIFQLSVLNYADLGNREDPCVVLERAGAAIVPVLPK